MSFEAKVEHLGLDELIPYAGNARNHPDDQVADLAAIIREFGFTQPLLIRGDATIIAGHGRLLAARQLGLETVPVIRCDHLSVAQSKALTLADNRISEKGGWNQDVLKIELEGLQLLDVSMDLTGFNEGEIDDILDGFEDDQDLPAPQAEGETKTSARTLNIDDLRLQVTDAEAELFKSAVAKYADQKGTTFGFINHLLASP